MNVAIWLQRTAQLYPERPALYSGDRLTATYSALGEQTCRLAGGLTDKLRLQPGDRVAVYMPNAPEYLALLYAVWHAGGAAVPINYKLHPKEAAFIVENAGARAVFVASAAAALDLQAALDDHTDGPELIDLEGESFRELQAAQSLPEPATRARDDLAWLFYTSGTTGQPKGVMITHGNIHAMSFSYFVDVDEVRTDDVALYAAPMSHGAGLYNFMHVLRGAAHSVPESGGFDPAEILALGRSLKSVHMFAAPTMVRRLVDRAKAEGADGEGIRTIVYGGGPMYVADIEDAVAAMGPRFVQIYGQGECPMTITALPRNMVADRSHPRWRERLGSVGFAQSCVEVRILKEDGTPCAVGEDGEIAVHGAAVMAGYWQNGEATEKSLRDGWLWTGDVGRMDADGFVTLTDRSKDVIISGGTNIYPREVEEVLLQLEDIAEVSVIGSPDAEWGEVIVAFVVPRDGAQLSEAELDAHCLANMARFKRPKTYLFIDALPKNAYGKVLKTDLRQRLSDTRT
ncbi:AMP-binding protein [Roseibium aggregatum]|uniref:3-methylmercaptopropionyl-CoA ligase n=1 Tax=Roseibium aggregatum TaxID=187304 RepID=A0A926S6E7_9HYPH|nr:AMP-binding protein [Roseibium aggregatum]MBD1547461.1 AMP-binding protein [Roseibium aggregatum]